MSKINIKHGRTVVYNVNYHIVWSTKYRKKVLTGNIEQRLRVLMNEITKDKGFEIKSMKIMPDHIHVFVTAHPKYSPSYIYKMLKGISGRKLFIEFPDLKKQSWRGHLWNPSTYIETIGHISEETIKKYIEDQKKK
ncbi:IS200/IS605 family transposase [Calditerrivibrio nitroreducens]|uniref:Transposase IS200-family protein n=1 Tax=Calditerrivibrio nitroreducens (strain DSM 19672 / NBRC 101217 / Yu37-1) TaxID=768670 RepID=E4TK96_CALNY|nr:IS200/IS605 family transposase [Calditerrivibrio nitroreducens]ADR19968.1 transposase IS200-family protein [Calditerrivibrio nitroreducens DSM 19672]